MEPGETIQIVKRSGDGKIVAKNHKAGSNVCEEASDDPADIVSFVRSVLVDSDIDPQADRMEELHQRILRLEDYVANMMGE